MYLEPDQSAAFGSDVFNAIVGPRPIGWISSRSATGNVNLAPFSYFNGVSSTQAMLMFACNAPRDRPEKDTLVNVRETEEFVFNLASWDLRESVNLTSVTVPYGVDEFAVAELEPAACRHVKVPRVAAAPASIECKLVRIVPIEDGDSLSTIVIGRAVGIHIADAYLTARGGFDFAKARPLLRMGGISYATIDPDIVEMPRPSVPVETRHNGSRGTH